MGQQIVPVRGRQRLHIREKEILAHGERARSPVIGGIRGVRPAVNAYPAEIVT